MMAPFDIAALARAAGIPCLVSVTLASAMLSASATDYNALINDTPCLLAYREWFYTFAGKRTSEFDPASAGATAEQCDAAKKVHERIAAEQAAQAAADEEQRRKRDAAQERKSKEAAAQERARRELQASKPGVRIGMTKAQVINETSWGKPLRVNKTTTAAGTREQWVYGSGSYLYFRDEVLTAVQN